MKINVFIISILLLTTTCYAQITVSSKVNTLENKSQVSLEFANVLVLLSSDTTKIVQGVTTNSIGEFKISNLSREKYKFHFSYVGYKVKTIDLDLTNVLSDNYVLETILLEVDTGMLSEILVEAKRMRQDIDKQVYTFSKTDVDKSREARDLLLNIPQLRIDQLSNTLVNTDGKSLIILVNGVKTDDTFLKMIPAHKVKKVDFYDVPPIKYATEGKVLNIQTKELDTGVAIDFYGITGQMFSQVNPTISYIKGRNMFTVEYSYHLNPKRNVKDFERGKYEYSLATDNYKYEYSKEMERYGNQNGITLGYSNYKENDYVFQAKVNTEFDKVNNNETKNIELTKNQLFEKTDGFLTDEVKTFSPSIDLFYSKQFKDNRQLDFNVVATSFENKQQMLSVENGTFGFKDNMKLENNKKSLIGEISYATHTKKQQLNFGYKTNYSTLNNTVSNIFSEGQDLKYIINIQSHYLYGETKGKISKLNYRLSLGANLINTKTETGSETNVFFMPIGLIGYKIDNNQTIRLILESTTTIPNAQQLSNNAIVVMKNFISKGNPQLQNSILSDLRLRYGLNYKVLDLTADLFLQNQQNEIFQNFKKEQPFDNNIDYIVMMNENANISNKIGSKVNVTFKLFDFLSIGGNFSAYRHTFQPTQSIKEQSLYFFPITAYANAKYKNFTLDYYQKFNSNYLEGLYIMGIEKVSYLSFEYNIKDWTLGLKYYFPFHKDTFKNYIYSHDVIAYDMWSQLKSKEKTVGISISWNFNSSRKEYNAERNIYNEDYDKGTFELK